MPGPGLTQLSQTRDRAPPPDTPPGLLTNDNFNVITFGQEHKQIVKNGHGQGPAPCPVKDEVRVRSKWASRSRFRSDSVSMKLFYISLLLESRWVLSISNKCCHKKNAKILRKCFYFVFDVSQNSKADYTVMVKSSRKYKKDILDLVAFTSTAARSRGKWKTK